jgi:hypothetical protein
MQKAEALLGAMLKKVRSSNAKLASSQSHGPDTLQISSPAFKQGFPIPRKYTQDDQNISPPLSWSGVPKSARELVLVVEDPDAPRPQPVMHWIIYRIPPTASGLPENVPPGVNVSNPAGAMQSRNYSGEERYVGPKPPVGHGVHHYHFQLFALDAPLQAGEHPDKEQLLNAMQGHVIAQGELVGTYERVAPES